MRSIIEAIVDGYVKQDERDLLTKETIESKSLHGDTGFQVHRDFHNGVPVDDIEVT